MNVNQLFEKPALPEPPSGAAVQCNALLEHVAKQLEKSWAGYNKSSSESSDSRGSEYNSIKAEIMWEIQYAIRQSIKECSNK